MKKMLVVLGPTATGKTDLAIHLAEKFNGEIISADSRQIYRDLDIGTGKVTKPDLKIVKSKKHWVVNGIKIWMYDVITPNAQYNVAKYVSDASLVIEEIRNRGKLPILVGGTGLYIKALVDGLSNLEITVDNKLRKDLEKLSKEKLQKKLQQISKKKWDSLNESDKENPRRLIRAIEIEILPRVSAKNFPGIAKSSDILKIGLTAKREILYKRVDESVLSRIKQGMVVEVEKLYKNNLSLKRMKQLGLEYGILANYIEGKIENKELEKVLQSKIHGFVRRQLTWFKKEKAVKWFDISDKNFSHMVEELVRIWYDKFDANKN